MLITRDTPYNKERMVEKQIEKKYNIQTTIILHILSKAREKVV